jgi:epoxyqueuosine reductase
MRNTELKTQIKEFAVSEGANLVGVAPVETYHEYYAGVEGRMKETGATLIDFMVSADDTTFFERLSCARNTLPTAKAIILIAVYGYDEAAVYRNNRKELRGKTARIYSYYPVVRQVAEKLTAFLQDMGYNATQGQDVPLKYVFNRVGLGAYGKNGILITRDYGSYVALRDVITDAPLEPDEFKRPLFCEDCDLCIKACPTGALYAPYKVNPCLCINPINRRENYIAPQIRPKMQNWISGCDICQEVCPANRHLVPREKDPRSGFDSKHHSSHRNLDGFEKLPRLMHLLGGEYPDIIRRNAAIALANIDEGQKEVIEVLKEQMGGIGEELREYFCWAIKRGSATALSTEKLSKNFPLQSKYH